MLASTQPAAQRNATHRSRRSELLSEPRRFALKIPDVPSQHVVMIQSIIESTSKLVMRCQCRVSSLQSNRGKDTRMHTHTGRSLSYLSVLHVERRSKLAAKRSTLIHVLLFAPRLLVPPAASNPVPALLPAAALPLSVGCPSAAPPEPAAPAPAATIRRVRLPCTLSTVHPRTSNTRVTLLASSSSGELPPPPLALPKRSLPPTSVTGMVGVGLPNSRPTTPDFGQRPAEMMAVSGEQRSQNTRPHPRQ